MPGMFVPTHNSLHSKLMSIHFSLFVDMGMKTHFKGHLWIVIGKNWLSNKVYKVAAGHEWAGWRPPVWCVPSVSSFSYFARLQEVLTLKNISQSWYVFFYTDGSKSLFISCSNSEAWNGKVPSLEVCCQIRKTDQIQIVSIVSYQEWLPCQCHT